MSPSAVSDGAIFAQDKKFWNNYLKGRPDPPPALFDRIFAYHAAHHGTFGTAHDAGAGNGPHATKLRSRFGHVIVSDIVPDNVTLARDRLGGAAEGFSFRAARLEEADDIPVASVDLVFAANVMHFPPNQHAAMAAVARQLAPGGTFAATVFGPARFEDAKLQDLWERISQQGGRVLLKKAERPDETAGVMARTQDKYNAAPLDTELFQPGALRVHLNMSKGGIVRLLPPEEAHRNQEPNYSGPDDVNVFEEEDGWGFEADLEGVKEHILSFPFVSADPVAFEGLFLELESLLGDGRTVRGYWPAKVILATRR